jgi:ferredoxin
MSKVTHDRNKCIHCGICTSVSPELFEDNGEITLKNAEYKDGIGSIEVEDDASAKTAAEACPVLAIEVK